MGNSKRTSDGRLIEAQSSPFLLFDDEATDQTLE